MRLPLSYPLRNLSRRPWRTAMTVAGIAIVVFAAALMLALSRGVLVRLDVTGEPQNLLVISRAGQNTMFSSITEDELVQLIGLPGVAVDANGGKLVSPEIMHGAFVGMGPAPENEEDASVRKPPVYVRGVRDLGYSVHRSVKLVEGHLPEKDFDLLVGPTVHVKMGVPQSALGVGATLHFEGKTWTICGRYTANGGIIESELWAREQDMMTVLRRRTHTFACIRFTSPRQVDEALALFRTSGAIERFFKGWPEKQYYRDYTKALAWMFWLSLFMVAAITAAGALIGVNTMYTAIISRIDEIGTLRVLGFCRADIVVSLLIESTATSLLGGVIGISLSFAVNGLPMRLSQGAFTLVVDWQVLVGGLILAMLIGALGALIPTIKGLRMTIIRALKYT